MVKTLLILVLCLISSQFYAQNFQKPSAKEIQTLPLWAQKMYGEHPNVFEVDSLVRSYYKTHTFQKNYHTQYYKRWKRSLRDLTGADGYPIVLTAEQKATNKATFKAKSTEKSGNSDWSIVGPITNFQEGLSQGSGQTNVYSFDQCIGSPTFMYCGTEPGEVYKSIDGGNNWTLTSKDEDFGSGVTSVEVDPVNPQIVFAGGNDGVFRSIDGGTTWTNVLPNSNFGVNEILINSGNTQIVLAATDKGLYRSTDGGVNWTQLFLNKTYDLKMNVVTSSTVYLLRNNPNDVICEFAISTDSGLTWTVQSTGWYTSTDPARNDGGGRLAVTPADPNRVYAYLIGEAKANDYGYIGVYKSSDGGMSWTLPNGPAGGPYDANHINLAIGNSTWLYHQGFYNCAIMANPTDADDIIVGGLSTYHSTDGAATFESINGYAGGFLNMHVDNQDFRVIGNEFWITTDGGIYHSTDFFTTEPEFKMSGVHGSDYWGFGSGWNEDVLVGGLYHNGNLAYHENYGAGNFLELGGGEAPTGYVNPGNNRKTYFSDIDGKIIPLNLNDPIQNSAFSIDPNESYWSAESSEMEFHPNCYNVAYFGKNADIWKTTDGGGSFQLLHNFSASTNAYIAHIEVASDNPDVIYTHLRPASGATGTLFKTVDGGVNWSQLTIPSGNSSRLLIAVDPENSSKIWIAYPSGSNGNKVYESTNGGTTWTNITSAALNNEEPHSMVYIAGTSGGLYIATNKATYYRDGGTNWQLDNANLPTFTNGNILRPFYRDGKIRLATYGKGIWESALSENPSHPIARIMVDKLSQEVTCAVDSFYFDDYSYLNHTGATWNWTFPTGTPTTSAQRNPAVYFDQAGTHLAILQITDGNGFSDIDSLYVTVTNVLLPQAQLMEDFETAFLPYAWSVNNPDEDGQWSQSADAGGFGTSPKSAIFDNFNTYGMGKLDDLIIPLDASLSITELTLKFDVAYARWGGANSDSLSVHVSTDCGQTMQQLFFNGGTGLSTSPDFQDFFIPTASQWRTETLDLSSFIGESNVQVIFRNHGYFGNGIYLDNINISSDLGIESTKFKDVYQVYPNPSSAGNSVFVEVPENATIYLIDQKGKRVSSTKGNGKIQFDLPASVSAGMYQLQIVTEKEIVNKRLMITK